MDCGGRGLGLDPLRVRGLPCAPGLVLDLFSSCITSTASKGVDDTRVADDAAVEEDSILTSRHLQKSHPLKKNFPTNNASNFGYTRPLLYDNYTLTKVVALSQDR